MVREITSLMRPDLILKMLISAFIKSFLYNKNLSSLHNKDDKRFKPYFKLPSNLMYIDGS